jgi:hypothetical protein
MATGPLPVDHPIYSTILLEYNKLRKLEDRPQVTSLPTYFEHLTHARLLSLSFRLKKESQWHTNSKRANRSLDLEYKNQIFLNDTEYQLWLYNNRQEKLNLPPVTHIPASFVSENDTEYYLTNSINPDELLFITDSPVSLINTPTYVDALKSYRATHSLTSSYHVQQPISSITFDDSHFDLRLPSSSPLNSSTEVNNIPIEGLRLEGDNSTDKIASISSQSVSSKMSEPDENDPRKDIIMEQALMKIHKLEQENERLRKNFKNLTIQPRAAQTERHQISDLQTQIDDLTQMVKMMNTQSPLDVTQVTDSERKIADKIKGATVKPAVAQLFVSLERPTNIIDNTTPREPANLQCLKPSAIINTIGTYDPDNQPDADFRCIWDRILDHTRNNVLYEHEYITCLRIILKGSAGVALDKLNKEYGGNLDSILDALQDLFIPQHTIFDEFVELNQFKRKANEHMRTMVRRASLLIFKLKDTVSPAAWEDRRHTLLSQIIKQVIDRKTFVHLRAEEIKCAQLGQSLTIEAMTNIIEFFESANDLIPKNDLKLTYDVQTMRLTNQPDIHQTELTDLKNEISSLKASIKVLAPKRPRFNETTSLAHKNKQNNRTPIIAKRRLDNKMDTNNTDKQGYKGVKRPLDGNNQPQYKPSIPKPPLKPPYAPQATITPYKPYNNYNNYNNYQQRNKPRYDPQLYSRYNTTKLDQYDRTHYKKRYPNNRYRTPKKSYSFKGKKHNVELKFYKCSICPDAHEQGTSCSTMRSIPVSPNAY